MVAHALDGRWPYGARTILRARAMDVARSLDAAPHLCVAHVPTFARLRVVGDRDTRRRRRPQHGHLHALLCAHGAAATRARAGAARERVPAAARSLLARGAWHEQP